jgi:predicted O-methyltransferase YrrM
MSKKKKLLYVTSHLSTGGMPQYLLKQIESFIHEFEIQVVEYNDHSGNAYVVQKNKIKDICKVHTLYENKEELLTIIKEYGPDIIHFTEVPEHFIESRYLDSIFSNTTRKYFIVVSTHGSHTNPDEIQYHPDRYVLVSEWSRRKFEHLGVDTSVWEYPIQAEIYDKSEFKKELGFEEDWKHVLMVGLFTSGKNQGEVFTIARQLEKYKIKFHFIGNQAINFEEYWGPLMETKPPNCIVWGERNDVDKFYKASDLFYFSSILELNPLSIKEALGYQLPCIFRRLDTYLDTYDNNELVTYIDSDLSKTKQYILQFLKPEFNEIPGWFSYKELYDSMVESALFNSTFVEIGAWFGKSTNYLANKIKESKKNIHFITIDTFKGTETETLHQTIVNQFDGDIFFEFVDNTIQSNNYGVVDTIKDTSKNASSTFSNSSIDFLMIDAGHEYNEVSDDIHRWYHKVKPGGIISGDDYGTNMFPGVTQAVNEYFYSQVNQQQWNWVVRKPRIQIKHLMTKPNDLRERVSQASLKQLERYGMIYEPIVNEPYRSVPPKEFCRRPEHVSETNTPGELHPGAGLGWITGGHYGCYMAHRGALETIDADNFDYTLIFEADAFIYTGLEEFVNIVHKACFISERDNIPYIGLANNPSRSKEKIDELFSKTAHNQDLAHAYLIPNREKQWWLDRIRDCEWDAADLWYNHVFYHHSRPRYTTNKMYSNQAEGYSLLDNQFKSWK